jgi:hypothetical protein
LSFISRRESRGASKVKAENNDKKQAIISSNIVKISVDWQSLFNQVTSLFKVTYTMQLCLHDIGLNQKCYACMISILDQKCGIRDRRQPAIIIF